MLWEFPPVVNYVETLEWQLHSTDVQERFPGLVVAYRPAVWIYHHWLLLLDPTKLVRLWRCSTVMIDGIYLGTDKIVHFAHMGYLYFSTYRRALADGADEAEATRRAVRLGNGNNLLSEGAFLGFFTTGVISNGDLASNYAGLKFYRNLTEPIRLRGAMQPPLLVRNGEWFQLNDHVRRNSDFFQLFVSDHWDEALNPSVYALGMGLPMQQEIRDRCADVRTWYRDEQGRPLRQDDFRRIALALTNYFGEDYGHVGQLDDMVTIANTCFEAQSLYSGVAPDRVSPMLENGGWVGAPANSTGTGDRLPAHRVPPRETRDAFGRTALWRAARAGRLDEVRELLADRVNVTVADIDGETPLHAAARSGHAEAVIRLVEAGAAPGVPNVYGLTPLHLAVRSRSPQTVGALLTAGALVTARDTFGRTPLHDAAGYGFGRICATLIAAGADVNAADNFGTTPMHLAAREGYTAIVSALLAAGADDDRLDAFGRRPFDEARRNGHGQTATVIARHRNRVGSAEALAPRTAGTNRP